MAELKDSGERTEFSTGAVRDMHQGKGRFDLLPWNAIHDVAKHCEDGAHKYGERNVDKGIPQHSLIDSALRHLSRYIRGEMDEPHLRAAAWNVLWALEQETTHPELNDLPNRANTIEDDTTEIQDVIKNYCQTRGSCMECKLIEHIRNTNHQIIGADCFAYLSRDELLEHYKIIFGEDWKS